MAFRPKIKNAVGTLVDLPLAAETAVLADKAKLLVNNRTIGLSGVTSSAKPFNGSVNVVIPITAIPSTLLTGTIVNERLPIGGVKLGCVKNGGNITINGDGTLNHKNINASDVSVTPRESLGNLSNLDDVLNYIGSMLGQ